jgi:hypothetical protein
VELVRTQGKRGRLTVTVTQAARPPLLTEIAAVPVRCAVTTPLPVGREGYVIACDLRILTTPAEEELHEGNGAFLTLTANGQDALRAIGADQSMLGASFPATRLRLFNPDGALLADAPLGHDHPCPRSITRAALSGLLRAKAADHGVPVHFGKRVATADIGQDGTVTATFGDGTRATGDLLIGRGQRRESRTVPSRFQERRPGRFWVRPPHRLGR